MGADENSNLVAFTVKYVFEKTGKPLGEKEQDILKQIFEGKQLKKLRYQSLANDSIIKNIVYGKLFKLLKQATDKDIGIKNVKWLMEEILREERSLSENTPQLPSPTEIKIALNGHATFNGSNGSVSCSDLGNGQSSSQQANSVGSEEPTLSQSGVSYCLNPNCTNRQNPNHLDYCQACSTLLLINGQQHRSSEADNSENLEVEDCSPNHRVEEFPLASYTSQPDTHQPNPRSDSLGWHNFINFIKPGVPLLLSAGILGSGFALSWVANWYGVKNHLAGNLSQAQFGYNLAQTFNAYSAAAHYNQGANYEDLGKHDYNKAHDKYTQAFSSGSIEACNNKARLYNLTKEYDQAVHLLEQCLSQAKQAKDDDAKSTILKNRGWARMGQGRLVDAEPDLKLSIQLNKRKAVPYCLLAQVLERKGDKKTALEQWKKCNTYAYPPKLPEEDKLFYLATKRIDAEGSKK